MTTRLPGEVDLGSVQDAVGPAAWEAAHQALAEQVTGQVMWQGADGTLRGYMLTGSEFVQTTIHLSPGRRLQFVRSTCTCRWHDNCQHAAALTLAAAKANGQRITARAVPEWEQALGSLLPAAAGAGPVPAVTVPIAVEVTLRVHSSGGRARKIGLDARLMSPEGKNGNWIAGGLSWSKLDSLRYYGNYPVQHLDLLTELYKAWRAEGGDGYSSYYGSDRRHIDLASCSRQLWLLLDDAVAAGLPLRHPGKLGHLSAPGTASLCIDVGAGVGDGDLLVSGMMDVAGTGPVVTVGFVGSPAHGIAYLTGHEAGRDPDPAKWRFGLARLAKPVPAPVQELVQSDQMLEIPASQRDRFCAAYYPRLRQLATVVSSDESFDQPEISGPTLVLGAAFGDEHSVDVSFEWLYQVGDKTVRRPVGAAGDAQHGYADEAAEQVILDSLGVPVEEFVGTARLTGLDTMRFSTEVLPLMAGQSGVELEISGERADYREVSDSLQIAVSADGIDGERDWFDLGVTVSVDGQEVPFAPMFVALSQGDPHLLLPSGAYFSLDKPELRTLARLIGEARTLQDKPGSELRISRFQADLWNEFASLGVIERQAAEWERQVAGLLSVAGLADGDEDATGAALVPDSPPDSLTAQLRPYQLDGFQWLAFLWEHQLGGILADDMGLGKTLQALALICHARQSDPDEQRPFLIVAPTSVVSNWVTEAERFAPGLKVAAVTSTVARSCLDLEQVAAHSDVVVTTYALLRIDFGEYSRVQWAGLFLDEAQAVKNHQSRVYTCARKLSAPFKLAITGTPMENNLMELWSLLSITAPGLFPSPARFQDYYAKPVEKHGNGELLGQLRRRVKPLMKRRTKEQVAADLPEKQEQVLEVEMHPRHRELYLRRLQRERQKVLGLVGDVDSNRFVILKSITTMRQLALHAGLVDPADENVPCAKIDAMLDQLEEVVSGGHRALVFSQFTGFLSRVRARLDKAGIEYCYLDGSTTRRGAVIRDFKTGTAPVFLISLKAGGFGLNLTEADYCFLLDPWWNPATEAQAVDRTHRIGQTRNVVVYRLISAGTIEEKVMALKARKAELFSSVMNSGNVFGSKLSADDIRGLFA